MFLAARRLATAIRRWVAVKRALALADKSLVTRRQREAQKNFRMLRARLDRENQLHALMLSQRHFRRS